MNDLADRLEGRLRAFRRVRGNAKYNEAQARLAFALLPYLNDAERRRIEPFVSDCRGFLEAAAADDDRALKRLWDTIEGDERSSGFSATTFVLRALTAAYHARRDFFGDGSETQFIDWTIYEATDKLGLTATKIEEIFVGAFDEGV